MRFKSILFPILILAGAITAFAQDGRISGKVTFNDNVLLHDASVQIIQLRRTVLTNDDGIYEFTNVPPGRYTLLVHIDGFSDTAKIIDVEAGAQLTVDFAMQVRGVNEQVTVTASGSEQTVFDSFQSVTTVGSAGIMQRSATSIGEVLDGESGISKRSFGVGSSRPVIRGFDGDRVLILQDGQRTGSIGSQSGDHGETNDTTTAERIEVVKGPGTLLYGSNAIGGVVNVIGNDENKPHDGIRGFLTGVGGTANRQGGLSGGLDYGFRNWIFRGGASAQRTGDYQSPIGRIPNSASRSNSGNFSTGYYSNRIWAAASFDADIRRYGIPYAAFFEGGGGMKTFGEIPPTPDEDVDLRQRSYGYRFKGGFRDLRNPFVSEIQYNVGYSDYNHKEIEVIDGEDEIGTVFSNKTFSYRSMFEQTKYKALSGRFGFEGFSRDYLVTGAEQLVDGKIRQNSFSVFGLEELAFDRVRFQFGGRVENNRYAAENSVYRDRNFTGISGAVGMNVSLWKGGAFVVNYSNSFRAPALEELYNNGPHIGTVTFEIGNENLKGERSNGIDVSLRHVSERFNFTGDVYYYRIKNFVFLAFQDEDGDGDVDIEDGLPVARYEQEDASYLGFEVGAEGRFNKYFGAYFNADAVRARLPELNLDLPRIPQARLRIGADFLYKGLNVRPELSFVRKQNKTYPLETPTSGYSTFDINGSYTIATDHFAHIFTVSAYNLTDRLYRNHLSFIKDLAPEMGRGIRVGYTFRFF